MQALLTAYTRNYVWGDSSGLRNSPLILGIFIPCKLAYLGLVFGKHAKFEEHRLGLGNNAEQQAFPAITEPGWLSAGSDTRKSDASSHPHLASDAVTVRAARGTAFVSHHHHCRNRNRSGDTRLAAD